MASQSQPLLDSLECSLRELIAQYDTLSEQLESLRYQNEQLRSEMVRTHAELAQIQKQYRNLHSAYTLAGNTEQREQAKRRITYLIENIDKALEYLTVDA